ARKQNDPSGGSGRVGGGLVSARSAVSSSGARAPRSPDPSGRGDGAHGGAGRTPCTKPSGARTMGQPAVQLSGGRGNPEPYAGVIVGTARGIVIFFTTRGRHPVAHVHHIFFSSA